MSNMNRMPPREIQESLRKEVNFGCPVQFCGVPYLTFHHFDPAWSEKEHHNPDGMIALCAKHAAQADGGRWTKEQVRKMKENPYVTLDKVSEYYGYLRKNVVCIAGFVSYGMQNVLEIHGERVIGFEIDAEGYHRLNLFIRDRTGSPVLVMENNYWTALSRELFDLRCSYRGRELEIISKDKQTELSMRFDDYSVDAFKQQLIDSYAQSLQKSRPPWLNNAGSWVDESLQACRLNVEELISRLGNPQSVPTWTMRGRLNWGGFHLEIQDWRIEELNRHMTFTGAIATGGGGAAFSFG